MKKLLARMFGLGEKEAEESSPMPLPKTGFQNTVQPSSSNATNALNLLEMRLKEEQTVERIKQLFRSSGRTMASALEPHQTIELVEQKYGRIWKMIVMMWGSRELHRKLQEILYIDTDGRAGFPFDVVAVLMRIFDIHAEEFGFQGGMHDDKARRGLAFMSDAEAAHTKKKEDASIREVPSQPKRDKW